MSAINDLEMQEIITVAHAVRSKESVAGMPVDALEAVVRRWLLVARDVMHQGGVSRANVFIQCANNLIGAIAALNATLTQPAPEGIVGEVVEIGDGEDGQPRIIIHTTADEIRKHAGQILFKRVTVAATPQGGAA